MKNIVTLLLALIWLTGCVQSKMGTYAGHRPPNGSFDSGKCYAKCLMPDQYDEYYEYFYRYTGADAENTAGVVYTTISTGKATTRWEKKKVDNNCRSANPEDCLVWCLVKVPEESISVYVVQDTANVHEYVFDSIGISTLVKKGGYTEWLEVVCEADVSPALYEKIQAALLEEGYEVTDKSGTFGKSSKKALKQYQKDYDLPQGGLNIETMKTLGINY